MCPSYVSFVSQLSQETDLHGSGEYQRYLIGFTLSSADSHTTISLDTNTTRAGSEVGTELSEKEGGGGGPVAGVAEKILYEDQGAILRQSLLSYEVTNEGMHPPPPHPSEE
jgi:hypothetical protein